MANRGIFFRVGLIFALVLLSTFYFLLFPHSAEAISISPLTYEINVNPGQVVQDMVTVYNNGSADTPINMSAEDFTPIGESGGVVIEPLPADISAKGWITFSPDSFILKPGTSQDIGYTLKVPENAEPGGHYAAIVAGTGSPGETQSGTSLAQKLASLLLIKVSGTIKEEMTLKEFSAPQLSEYPPIKFSARFENTGSVHMKPAGNITIKDSFGNVVDKIDLPQLRVLPNTVRLVEIIWDAPKWRFGKFHAELSAIYGSQNEPVGAAVDFWILPWKMLSGVAAGIIVIATILWLGRRRVKLAVRILFKGEHAVG